MSLRKLLDYHYGSDNAAYLLDVAGFGAGFTLGLLQQHGLAPEDSRFYAAAVPIARGIYTSKRDALDSVRYARSCLEERLARGEDSPELREHIGAQAAVGSALGLAGGVSRGSMWVLGGYVLGQFSGGVLLR